MCSRPVCVRARLHITVTYSHYKCWSRSHENKQTIKTLKNIYKKQFATRITLQKTQRHDLHISLCKILKEIYCNSRNACIPSALATESS